MIIEDKTKGKYAGPFEPGQVYRSDCGDYYFCALVKRTTDTRRLFNMNTGVCWDYNAVAYPGEFVPVSSARLVVGE